MGARTVYRSQTGRVLLIQHNHGRARSYSVEIAGGEYGPFPWSEALAWYTRHKDADANARTGFIVKYDSGAYLRAPGMPYLSPDALTLSPADACQFETSGAASRAVSEHGQSMVSWRTYSGRYWRRICARFKRAEARFQREARS